MSLQKSDQETRRLAALREYELLDTPPEPSFDRLTRIAAHVLHVPYALLTLMDEDRLFFKSCYGVEAKQAPRGLTFCSQVAESGEVLVTPNALADPRFSSNPFVSGPPGVLFYAGAPLIASTGFHLGALCVFDLIPHPIPDEYQLAVLQDLAAEAVEHIEHRLTRRNLSAYAATVRQQEIAFREHQRLWLRTEQRAAMALEAGQMGFWEWDAIADHATWSPQMEQLFGLPAGTYDGAHRTWIKCIHPDDRPASEARRFRNDSTFLTKYRILCPDGSMRWIGERGSYQRDPDGKLLSGFGVCWDCTERENQNLSLRQSEELFRGLSAACPAGIYRANLDGLVTYANPRALEIWEMSSEEALNLGWVDRVHEEDRDPVVSRWIEANAQARSFNMEFRIVLPCGELRWIHGRSAILFELDGRPSAVVGTVDDITEGKRAAIAMHEAQLEAEAASDAKDLFLANVSHELRTPLNGILGMTELILQGPLPREQREHTEAVRQSGETLLAVVNDILDISKIEAGTLRIDVAPFDLRSTVERSAAFVRRVIEAKGLDFSIDYPATLPAGFVGDSNRIQQILVNFLTNAIKFTDKGNVTCEVRVNDIAGGSREVRLAVRDSGCGISEEAQARLFQPFSQIDRSASRAHGGVGLGLAISRRLAGLMGGAVGVSSASNAGATFWLALRLPVCEPAAKPQLPAVSEPRTDVSTANRGSTAKRGKVLVAEDNLVNQRVVTKMLEKLGWEAELASDGMIAVDMASQNAYAVILMDCQMPVEDGYAASARIRELEAKTSRTRTPIIALTANAMPGDRERCLAAGMDDYVAKPLQMETLKVTIERWSSPAVPTITVS